MSSRPRNADGTPWWVSTGPKPAGSPTVSEQLADEAPTVGAEDTSHSQNASSDSSQENVWSSLFEQVADPNKQAAVISTGLGLVTTFLDVIAKPLQDDATSTHDPQTCGVCPLCVAVAAVREQDEGLADLIESAMKGVTGSVEKLTHLLPDVTDKITEAVVAAAVKAVLHR